MNLDNIPIEKQEKLLNKGYSDRDNAECVFMLHGYKLKYIIETCELLLYTDGYYQGGIVAEHETKLLIANTLKLRTLLAINKIKELETERITNDDTITKIRLHEIKQEITRLNKIISRCITDTKNESSILDSLITLNQLKINETIFQSVEYESRLNCNNGVLNLKTKRLLKHSHKYLFRYKLNIDYNPNAISDLWIQQLNETIVDFNNEQEVRDYIQWLFGYLITGDVTLKKAMLLHGVGDSGKSLLVNVFKRILPKNLTTTIAFNEIARDRAKSQNEQNFGLGKLKDTRFANVSEPTKDTKISEPTIKTLIGKEYFSAALKYKDGFDIKVTFKLVIPSNHAILADSSDVAVWNRFLIVPTFVGYTEIDPDREDKLITKQNLEGILAWLVNGAYSFYKNKRMPIPNKYVDELIKMKKDADLLEQWLDNSVYELINDDDEYTVFSDLYNDFVGWCEDNKYYNYHTSKAFSIALQSKGCTGTIKKVNKQAAKVIFKIRMRSL